MVRWKRDFASGLIVVVPLVVIVIVLDWLYQHVTSIPLVGSLDFAGWGVPAGLVPLVRTTLALLMLTLIVISAGQFMRTTAGRVAERTIDDFINRIPALRVVYNASKLAVETALSSGTEDLQQPVRLETWQGIRMTAFKTGKRTNDGKIVLFLPTAPNITSGYVLEVDPERVEETGEAVEEAMTRILSAGFADSPHEIPVEEATGDGEREPVGRRPSRSAESATNED